MNSNWSYSPETPNLGQIRRFLAVWPWNLKDDPQQGKSEGFDSCDRPSNLIQIGFKSSIFQPVWPWNLMDDPQKTIRHLFCATLSFLHHFVAIGEFKLEFQSGNAQFGSKLTIFFSRVTLKFDRWPWKTIGSLFYATSSFVHHFVAIGESKLELLSGNAQFGSKSTIFLAVWPWNLMDNLEKQ